MNNDLQRMLKIKYFLTSIARLSMVTGEHSYNLHKLFIQKTMNVGDFQTKAEQSNA